MPWDLSKYLKHLSVVVQISLILQLHVIDEQAWQQSDLN